MRQTRRYSVQKSDELNVWISLSDLMAGSLLILSLMSFLFFAFTILSKKKEELRSDVPPIIIIPDDKAFRFPIGSAQLSQPLRQYIWGNLTQTILTNRRKYKIDTIEVIGHTDGQPNQVPNGNLDSLLENSVAVKKLDSLVPSSNVDLGLMRALAITIELYKVQIKKSELKGLQFRAYSAGQLYLPNGSFALPDRNPDNSRRRIEVRFIRSATTKVVK